VKCMNYVHEPASLTALTRYRYAPVCSWRSSESAFMLGSVLRRPIYSLD
jgi:hypothetical protein